MVRARPPLLFRKTEPAHGYLGSPIPQPPSAPCPGACLFISLMALPSRGLKQRCRPRLGCPRLGLGASTRAVQAQAGGGAAISWLPAQAVTVAGEG